jgi:hypothetical protein
MQKQKTVTLLTRVISIAGLFSFIFLFYASYVQVGPGHGHSHGAAQVEVSKSDVLTSASKALSSLVKKGKIEKSWAKVKVNKTEKKAFGGQQNWVISFENKKEKDKKKRTLYVFFNLYGKYLGSNFTGK